MSSDIAVRESTEVEAIDAEEAALVAENQEAIDASDFVIPLLKVGQPLTDEVTTGDAGAGEFINALTRSGLGREIEFVVADYKKGRFWKKTQDEGGGVRVAYNTPTVPWPEDTFFGQPFTEHPDAEEQYKARVNSGEISWGSGPPISTTYNFTGYVLSEDDDPCPVRLSLMRTSAPMAQKWATILNAILRGRYWDSVFTLTTDQTKGDKGSYYTINVKQGRKPTPEERQRAVKLAGVLRTQTVKVVGEEGADPASRSATPPDAAGGIEV